VAATARRRVHADERADPPSRGWRWDGTKPVVHVLAKAFADGQAVWSWRPDAGAKFPERATRALGVTGAKEPGPRGEHGVSRQTIAQGRPGVSG
jgi:hypothetical protein